MAEDLDLEAMRDFVAAASGHRMKTPGASRSFLVRAGILSPRGGLTATYSAIRPPGLRHSRLGRSRKGRTSRILIGKVGRQR